MCLFNILCGITCYSSEWCNVIWIPKDEFSSVLPENSATQILRGGCSASGLQIAYLSSCGVELGDISFKANGGTTLRALNPGVSVNLATENEGQGALGKEGARWDFAFSAR
ncbi:hypothetical protein AVEN_33623-2 [Araneus ventricosus]|uniref:Uncharacterized protein n=1 Tax=Araneus ventricosus TaxID=182803 RepID=A0A4Y2N538_ARAVE|nr:hypothetical protein AVEN_33623-2 [Araneus ventricosus]